MQFDLLDLNFYFNIHFLNLNYLVFGVCIKQPQSPSLKLYFSKNVNFCICVVVQQQALSHDRVSMLGKHVLKIL